MTVLLAVLFSNEKFLLNEINDLANQRGSGLGTKRSCCTKAFNLKRYAVGEIDKGSKHVGSNPF